MSGEATSGTFTGAATALVGTVGGNPDPAKYTSVYASGTFAAASIALEISPDGETWFPLKEANGAGAAVTISADGYVRERWEGDLRLVAGAVTSVNWWVK